MIRQKAFNALDFKEAERVAEKVGFDVMRRATKLKSCGPGCKYFVNDKRYFVTTLLQHIQVMAAGGAALSPDVNEWRLKAQNAVEEYCRIEKRLGIGQR